MSVPDNFARNVGARRTEHGFESSARSAEHGFTLRKRSAEHGFTLRKRSAEHGFTSRRRSAEHGFTLIELLVALTVFAMLSIAGIMLLRSSVSAQGAVAERLDDDGRMLRTHALVQQDMRQVIARVTRTQSGLLAPAFYSRTPGGEEAILNFVRSGWPNLDDAARPSLQKAEYWLRDGRLERRTYPMLDGAQAGEPAVLLTDVERLDIALRARSGEWLDVWQAETLLALPVALRLTIKRSGAPAVTWVFVVAAGRETALKEGEEGGGG